MKRKVVGVTFIVLVVLAVLYAIFFGFGVSNHQPDVPTVGSEMRQVVESDADAHGVFKNRYGNDIVNELLATVGNLSSEQLVVAELAQKYEGREISSEERAEFEALLARTDSDGVKSIIRLILQTNDIRESSKAGAYQDIPNVPTVTIESLMTPIYSRFDGYIKATRIGGDISEPLFVYVTLSGASGVSDQIHIPAGKSEHIHRDTMYDIQGDVVTYEITGCKRRSPECDRANNYSLAKCTPLTVPCNIGDLNTATFRFAAREGKPAVTIRPVETPVSDPSDVAFEITRDGDISKYLSILLDCRSPGSYPEPLSGRTLIPAGTRKIVYPYPLTSATSVTCYVGASENYGHAEDSATVEVVSE